MYTRAHRDKVVVYLHRCSAIFKRLSSRRKDAATALCSRQRVGGRLRTRAAEWFLLVESQSSQSHATVELAAFSQALGRTPGTRRLDIPGIAPKAELPDCSQTMRRRCAVDAQTTRRLCVGHAQIMRRRIHRLEANTRTTPLAVRPAPQEDPRMIRGLMFLLHCTNASHKLRRR